MCRCGGAASSARSRRGGAQSQLGRDGRWATGRAGEYGVRPAQRHEERQQKAEGAAAVACSRRWGTAYPQQAQRRRRVPDIVAGRGGRGVVCPARRRQIGCRWSRLLDGGTVTLPQSREGCSRRIIGHPPTGSPAAPPPDGPRRGLQPDMPFISSATPFYLMRIDRKTWLMGQAAYIALATGIYLAFILISTSLVCMRQSFVGDMWSETAAILGYSGAGQKVALPALVKTLEMSRPYECMATIFLLMLLYTLLMVFVMLLFNLKKGQLAGVVSVFAFSLFGFLLNPQTIKAIFKLPDALMYKANVAVGWLSPLNQATYHMHNFGYDLLPRLWQTYLIFAMLIALCFFLSLRAVRNYNFNFGGTEA